MSNFRAIDRKTGYLLPPSVDEWLPEIHLARFIFEVIDELDLGQVQILDLDVRHDSRLQRFQRLPLGVVDGNALLFLPGEGFDLAIEFSGQSAGFGIVGHRFLRGFVPGNRRVIGHQF